MCLFIMDPHWAPISVMGFLSPCGKERLKHWAHGIKDTKAMDLLNGVNIY